MTFALLLSLCAAGASGKADQETTIRDAREVAAAVVAAAKANKARRVPLAGDELMEHYVRAAAAAARTLPKGRQGRRSPGFGVAVDPSALMRRNPVVGATWRRVETDEERKARLKVIGEAAVHGRHDLALHFGVSMALTAVLGEKKAESAGVVKELLDAMEGGSGFSFADLAADFAGVAFAKLAIERPEKLEAIEKGFRVRDYALPPKGLAEDLSLVEFEKRYGGTNDARFRKERDGLKRRIAALPGFR